MSCEKGNSARSRPQKFKNTKTFKNDLHDTSGRTKKILSTHINSVCSRCRDIIEWKIKYKKYKPLSQPRKCVKCEKKAVKHAYHVICLECSTAFGCCSKCCEVKELISANTTALDDAAKKIQMDNKLKNILDCLPERKRRSVLRYVNKNSAICDNEDDLDQYIATILGDLDLEEDTLSSNDEETES